MTRTDDVMIAGGSLVSLLSIWIAPIVTVLVGLATLVYTCIRVWETKTVQRWVKGPNG